MHTLVTGATGLVGNNVCRLLLERGNSVRVLLRSTSDPRALEGLDVECVYGDVCDAAAVAAACRGVSSVVHSAAMIHIGWRGIEKQREVNVTGSLNVAEAALREGVRMVHVSTVDTLAAGRRRQPANEETPGEKTPCTYVVTKREAEQAVLEVAAEGLQVVIVNPGFMLGPWDWKPSSGRMLLQVAKRFTPVAPAGGCSICDVRDVADGILAALARGKSGRRYVLGGHNLSYLEIWKAFSQAGKGLGPWSRLGPLLQALTGRLGDVATLVTGQESTVNSASLRMSKLFHYYDCQRAVNELAYKYRSIDDTVSDAWRWFKEHGYI